MKNKVTLLAFTMLAVIINAQVGVNTTNPQGVLHVDGKSSTATTNPTTGTPTAVQGSDDFVVTSSGSVGIGTSSPNPSAILELNVENGSKKGFLGPRVALTSYTDAATILSPASGLLVYNLGTEATFSYVGYVFWNGSEWRTLSGASLAPGIIGSITCNNAGLSPTSYITGTAYSGTLSIPYTGGNGGIYGGQTIGPVNGLTATLSAGNFAVGSGTLYYSVTGTPTVTSPTTTTFNIVVGGQTCSAIVGTGDDVKAGELVYYKANDISASIGSGGSDATTASNWLSANVDSSHSLPVIGGKLRLDGYFTGPANGAAGTVSFNPRLVNVSSSPVKFWFAALTNVDRFNGANIVLAPTGSGTTVSGGGGWVNLDNGIYSNYGSNGVTGSPSVSITNPGTANQEVLTMDINLDDKWYRVYYFINIDNNDTTTTSDDIRRLYLSVQRLY
jgi:hypothetical protein